METSNDEDKGEEAAETVDEVEVPLRKSLEKVCQNTASFNGNPMQLCDV
jgi:hypothetical protein